jgi:hypothetical protein
MATRDQILALLRGPEAARIRFSFPGAGGTVTIGPGTFRRVATAIAANRVHVQISNTMPAGVGAQYFATASPSNNPPVPLANTILTPKIIGRSDLGLALHECVHAAYDLQRTGLSALDDEASAYLVQTLYYRMAGLAAPQWMTTIKGAALQVVNGLLRQYQQGTRGIPAVDAPSWAVLRLTVMVTPIYMFPFAGTATPWRLGVVATGGNYTNDG